MRGFKASEPPAAGVRLRVRAAHIVLAGFAAQCAFATYAWFEATPQDTLEAVASGIAIAVLVLASLVGLLPAALLWSRSTHKAGRWTALVLGWVGVLSVFWSIQGLFLLAAFVWAIWKERDDPVAPGVPPQAPPSAPPS